MSTDFFQLSIAKERVDALDVILECYSILSSQQATEHGLECYTLDQYQRAQETVKKFCQSGLKTIAVLSLL